ncbi:MAG TPA: hypothetical protein VJB59_09850 [Bdellovibrionota bacterium]|nr:hypothetical protein [Bdellovibrionota bacterium]
MSEAPRKSETSDFNASESKQCDKCGYIKPLAAFYFKKDRNAYDKTCSDCRKSSRKDKYRGQIDEARNDSPDGEAIEPSVPIVEDDCDKSYHDDLPIMDEEALAEVVGLFQLLKQWYDEELVHGPIPGWQSINQ